MQSKLYAVLVTLVGILLLLPLLGVQGIGNVTEGPIAWVIAVAVLIIGIVGWVKSPRISSAKRRK